jgi:hypothetical protein
MRPPSRPALLTYALRTLTVALTAIPLLAVRASAAVNYVPNPGFESCGGAAPASWAPYATDGVSCNGTAASTGAFSMALSNPASVAIARAQSDCVVVPPSTPIQTFRFSYRTASSAVLQVALTANAYTATDCTGSNGVVSAGAGASFVEPIATDGNWHTLPTVTALTEATTHSIRFVASFQIDPATAIETVDFDDLEFTTASSTTSTPTSSSTSTSGATTSTTAMTVTSTTGSSAVTVTSTTGAAPTTLPPSFPGTGNAASECYVTLEGIAPNASGRLDCVDGDPACDADGAANGQCTFAFRVCVAQALPGCQAGRVTAVKAIPAALAIPLPSVPATTPACGAPAEVVVRLRRGGRRAGRRTLAFVAKSDGKPKGERDVVRLRCLPPA